MLLDSASKADNFWSPPEPNILNFLASSDPTIMNIIPIVFTTKILYFLRFFIINKYYKFSIVIFFLWSNLIALKKQERLLKSNCFLIYGIGTCINSIGTAQDAPPRSFALKIFRRPIFSIRLSISKFYQNYWKLFHVEKNWQRI